MVVASRGLCAEHATTHRQIVNELSTQGRCVPDPADPTGGNACLACNLDGENIRIVGSLNLHEGRITFVARIHEPTGGHFLFFCSGSAPHTHTIAL